MSNDDKRSSWMQIVIYVLFFGGIAYWVYSCDPKKKESKPSFVYQYNINDDYIQKGKRFVVTSLDTSYGDKRDGMPDVIEVTLSPE